MGVNIRGGRGIGKEGNDQGREEKDEDEEERKGEIERVREGKNWEEVVQLFKRRQDRGRLSQVKSVITDRLEWIGLTMTLTDYLNI